MKPQIHTLSPNNYQPPAGQPADIAADVRQREQQLQHSAIAGRAYTLWEKDGRRDGQDQEHWFKAESELHRSAGRSFRES